MSVKLRVISLGAGVQSTTLALMAAHGEIGPMPDCAIFADTKDEGAATYRHLQWLKSVLPFPCYEPTRGSVSEAMLAGNDEARIPAFVKGSGLSRRQCTRNWKIRPIRWEVRRILGAGPRGYIPPGTVEQWIGISLDEADRMKPAGVRFIANRWPLIEKRITRRDCKNWLLAHGYAIPPKSSCIDCAFQSDAQWQERKDTTPDEFAWACRIDEALRTPENIRRFRGELYLHRSCVPLAQVEFSPAAERERWFQPDMFVNECEGMCGV